MVALVFSDFSFVFYRRYKLLLVEVLLFWFTRAVRKVSGHFEYPENRPRGLDVTWLSVWGNLTMYPWTTTLPFVQSVGSETPLTELVYCVTVAFKIITFNGDFSFGKNQKSQRAKSGLWGEGGGRGLKDLNNVMLCQKKKNLHESCRMGRLIDVMNLICSLGHCECDGHTVHKLSQRLLTADWLAPRESDCSRMYSKVSSDWVPSYIKAMRSILEIFKMAGHFPDNPRTYRAFCAGY